MSTTMPKDESEPAPEPVWDNALVGLPLGAAWRPSPQIRWQASADITRALGIRTANMRVEVAFVMLAPRHAVVGIYYGEVSGYRRNLLPLLYGEEIVGSFGRCGVSTLLTLRAALGEAAAYRLVAELEGWLRRFERRPPPTGAVPPGSAASAARNRKPK